MFCPLPKRGRFDGKRRKWRILQSTQWKQGLRFSDPRKRQKWRKWRVSLGQRLHGLRTPCGGVAPTGTNFPCNLRSNFLTNEKVFGFFPKCGKKLSRFPANLSPNNNKNDPKKRCSHNLSSIFRLFLCETNFVPIFELELSFKIYYQLLKTKIIDCICKISCDIWFMSPSFCKYQFWHIKEETQRSRKSWQHVAYCNFKAPQFAGNWVIITHQMF